ncbi:hypothetical protein QO230_00650 [Vibrio vulnificus]|uniref:hypothetical protein n=1 Tax=Vibrio vulnificus TaxID=672 RepID=UPI0024DF3BDA|nr:hypothetical protein [Vibrio vulnificus]MDK2606124.1 hypothetical protein [Vibrio vulnificus]MDK2609868.1 hypothetical protein [Vibrio vulnificus]MDK2627366.1 hypothetical protein [Vibrio vulnificus]MDK2702811.1 hypothetical protein [Vibrio vulnificus]
MADPRTKIFRNEAERSKWRRFSANLNLNDQDTSAELIRDLFLLTVRSAKKSAEFDDALTILHKRYKRRVELVGSVG